MTTDSPDQLPWLNRPRVRLLEQIRAGRLPHALLIHGLPGLGKQQLASALMQSLLCTRLGDNGPCGQCKSCLLFAAGTHPDCRTFEPEDKSRVIKVDQIRQLVTFLGTTAQQGGYQCVLITPAEAMNPSAMNALLKSLEEPPGDACLILVSSAPANLSATIRSRCQQLAIAPPDRETALAWLSSRVGEGKQAKSLLALSNGAPLAALSAFREDLPTHQQQLYGALVEAALGHRAIPDIAKTLLEPSPETCAALLLNLLHSVIANRVAPENNDAEIGDLASVLAKVPLELVPRLYQKVLQRRQLLLSGANPNPQMIWEEILMDWAALCRQGRPAGQGAGLRRQTN